MTEHVRKNYRNHRKATWGFAIALMVAIAVVVIPIASGARQDLHDAVPRGAVTPPPVSGNTTSQTLCSGSNYTVKVAITNTTKSATARLRGRHVPRERDALERVVPAGRRGLADLEERQRRLTSAALASEERRGHDYRRPRHRGRRNVRAGDHRSRQAVERLQRLRLEPERERVRQPDVPDDSAFRSAPRPSPAACTTTATRAARSRSTPRRRRATSQSRGGRSHCSARRVRPPIPMSTPTRRTRTACTRSTGPIGSDFRLCVTAPNAA